MIKLNTSEIIMIIIIIIISIIFYFLERKPKSKIPINHEFLKAVDEGVKEIEAKRIQKRLKQHERLYCFNCEYEAKVRCFNDDEFCDNCGLVHTNHYTD